MAGAKAVAAAVATVTVLVKAETAWQLASDPSSTSMRSAITVKSTYKLSQANHLIIIPSHFLYSNLSYWIEMM